MASYTVHMVGPSSDPAQDKSEVVDDTEGTPADVWREWLEYAHEDILLAGGDADNDYDLLLSYALGHNEVETDAKIAAAEQRASKYATDTLREARDSNNKIAAVLRQQREAREQRQVEAETLARRLDRITDAIAAVTRENVELRTKLTACEQNLTKATSMLELATLPSRLQGLLEMLVDPALCVAQRLAEILKQRPSIFVAKLSNRPFETIILRVQFLVGLAAQPVQEFFCCVGGALFRFADHLSNDWKDYLVDELLQPSQPGLDVLEALGAQGVGHARRLRARGLLPPSAVEGVRQAPSLALAQVLRASKALGEANEPIAFRIVVRHWIAASALLAARSSAFAAWRLANSDAIF